jgi:hypothetical protein
MHPADVSSKFRLVWQEELLPVGVVFGSSHTCDSLSVIGQRPLRPRVI